MSRREGKGFSKRRKPQPTTKRGNDTMTLKEYAVLCEEEDEPLLLCPAGRIHLLTVRRG